MTTVFPRRSKTSTNCSRILKWNAGVIILRRSCHFFPARIKINWIDYYFPHRDWFVLISPLLRIRPSFNHGLRNLYSVDFVMYLGLLSKILKKKINYDRLLCNRNKAVRVKTKHRNEENKTTVRFSANWRRKTKTRRSTPLALRILPLSQSLFFAQCQV